MESSDGNAIEVEAFDVEMSAVNLVSVDIATEALASNAACNWDLVAGIFRAKTPSLAASHIIV